jgi:hypothetical protein
MENPAAFKATFHTTKYVLGRQVLQVVLECPIEQSPQVFDVLGTPNPAEPKWVAVALLKDGSDGTP